MQPSGEAARVGPETETVAVTATPAFAAGVVAVSSAFTDATNEPFTRAVAAWLVRFAVVTAVAIASLPFRTLATRPEIDCVAAVAVAAVPALSEPILACAETELLAARPFAIEVISHLPEVLFSEPLAVTDEPLL
jgi:hypothetical protein